MWKRLPTWLKGGIIGSITLVLLYPFFFISNIFPDSLFLNICQAIYFPGLLVAYLIYPTNPFGPTPILWHFFAIPFVILQGFIIGALIGWIVGKIKFRK